MNQLYTYIPISPPSCFSLPPSLSHPSRWSQSTELISETYTMFLDWKNQHCENDYTTQNNLQIQCNPYETTNGIFRRTRTKNFTICMETQKTPNSQSNLENVFCLIPYPSRGSPLKYGKALLIPLLGRTRFISLQG